MKNDQSHSFQKSQDEKNKNLLKRIARFFFFELRNKHIISIKAASISTAAALLTIVIGVFDIPLKAQSYIELFLSKDNSDIMYMGIVEENTRPLDGYPVLKSDKYGNVFAGGGRLQVSMQMTGKNTVALVSKIYLQIESANVPEDLLSKRYYIDPKKQPGFGSAEIRKFYVSIRKNSDGHVDGTSGYVVNDKILNADFPNLLPDEPKIAFHFDQNSGQQETLDINISAVTPGFYIIKLAALYVSGNKSHTTSTGGIYVYKQK